MNTCTSLIAEGVEEPGLEDFRAGWEAKSEKLGNTGGKGLGKELIESPLNFLDLAVILCMY